MSSIRDERGASMIIVIALFLAIFGMTTLVIDLGLQLISRRMVVRAVDAAVLAAAQTYALEEDGAFPGTNDTPAIAQADALATANLPGATLGVDLFRVDYQAYPAGSCPFPESGGVACVTARYRVTQDLIFAPAIGGSGTGAVSWMATAVWGPPGVGPPVPLMFNSGWLDMCGWPPESAGEGEPEPECEILWDNDKLGQATWGLLLLDGENWDVEKYGYTPADCALQSRQVAYMKEVIRNGGTEEPLVIDEDNPPTYVCVHGGLSDALLIGDPADATIENENPNVPPCTYPNCGIRRWEGHVLTFPVNDPAQQYPPITDDPNYKVEAAAIVGWIPLRVIDVMDFSQFGSESVNPRWCAQDPNNPDNGVPFTVGDEGLEPSPIAQGTQLDLVSLGLAHGCYTPETQIAEISQVKVSKAPEGAQYVEGTDYTLSADKKVLTWISPDDPPPAPPQPAQIRIAFKYRPGAQCGTQSTTNTSAFCIRVAWANEVGGEFPGGSEDFGLEALRLLT